MPELAPTLSHPSPASPASPHHLPRQDDAIVYPQLTERGPHVTEYEAESRTGVVSAKELVEGEAPLTASSSRTHVDKDAPSPGAAEKGQAEEDVKLVTWLENDPENPRNLPKWKKWVATMIASSLCFNAAFASAIITGGLDVTMNDLGTSEEVINLTVALFVVGFGVGPLVLAPVSELVGRKWIYLTSMAGMCIFTIPCAVAPNAGVLIAFRLISGLFASAPPTNAAGTIADVWDANSRGQKMATFAATLFAAPCLGPPIGGYMTMYAGDTWRSMYWLIVAMSGALFLVVLFCYDETYAPTLLGRRARKLRQETGDSSYTTAQERLRRPANEIVFEALARPVLMLTTELIMICFTAYLCLIYALLYGFFFAYPIVFAKGHGFSDGQVGLTFFGILIGILAVSFVACPFQERYYARKCAESPTGETVPESRLPLMMVNAIVLPISLAIFAATSDPSTNYWGPVISGIPFGFGLVGCYISGNTYLVDVYSQYGASAMAAKTFARSMAGASVPLWINYEYEHLGNRWAGAVFCFIAIAMAPIPFFFFKYGPAIRKRAMMATY